MRVVGVVVLRSVVYVANCVFLALGDALRRVKRVKWLMRGRGRRAKSDRVRAALRAAITERRESSLSLEHNLCANYHNLLYSLLDRVKLKSKACYTYSSDYNHG